MQNTKSTRKPAAIVALLALVLAACGGGESSDATESAPPSTQAATPTTEATMEPTQPVTGLSAVNSGAACSAVPMDGEGSFDGMADDPAATAASNNPVLSTLVTAVGEAGLVDTLNGEGPFTIFAPTDDAFAAIPEDQLNAILADQEQLTSILTYHVVAGESLDMQGLVDAGTVETVNGAELTIAPSGDLIEINGTAMVVCGNVQTANATVHIIDSVLVPEAGEAMTDLSATNIGPACSAVPADGEGSFAGMADDPAATAASNNPVLSTLVTAVSEAGLVDTLNGEGPFTIFAPTNDAFAAIPEDQLNAILGDPELLTSILTFHVVAGDDADLAQLIESGSVTTVQGEDLEIASNGDLASINGASVVCGNVQTANATVHIIDSVLVPAG
ncbi:MAG TPA: fasciclin domain-containing protein [Acidimicrobiia bacterium]|nr:fasciclin domain-containing protein [Acidimicrobiia bacterium]